MHNLIAQTIRLLQLQKPYKIVIKPKLKGGASAEYYEMRRKGKLVSHLIRINVDNMFADNARSFESLIVHEFIHAWQVENNIQESDHGPHFQDKAAFMGYMLNMGNIYLKGTDV